MFLSKGENYINRRHIYFLSWILIMTIHILYTCLVISPRNAFTSIYIIVWDATKVNNPRSCCKWLGTEHWRHLLYIMKKPKKGNGSTMYQNKHIFIFFFCFSSDTYTYLSDEILQPNRIGIKLYWITTYIDQLIVISILEIPKDSGIIQIGQVRHIIHFIKFGRIDLENLLFFQILFLKTKQIICVVWFLLYMSKPKSIHI